MLKQFQIDIDSVTCVILHSDRRLKLIKQFIKWTRSAIPSGQLSSCCCCRHLVQLYIPSQPELINNLSLLESANIGDTQTSFFSFIQYIDDDDMCVCRKENWAD